MVIRRSFMFDLIAGHPPFDQEEIESVLWRIGSGRMADLQDINCNARLKVNYLSYLWFKSRNEF